GGVCGRRDNMLRGGETGLEELHMRAIVCWMMCLAGAVFAGAAEPSTGSPVDEAISAAIAVLGSTLEKTDGVLAQGNIRKAIRELEAIRDGDGNEEAPAPVNFAVKAAVLKKKFKGKAAYDAKTGVLSLGYDFTKKDQLKDFELADAKPVLIDEALF